VLALDPGERMGRGGHGAHRRLEVGREEGGRREGAGRERGGERGDILQYTSLDVYRVFMHTAAGRRYSCKTTRDIKGVRC
jgi:hypothetical protein